MSRLIDANKLDIVFRDSDADGWSYEYITRVIEGQPTVHAIPLDKVKAAREEIDNNKCNTFNGCINKRIVLAMLDKLIAESEARE